MTARGPPVLRPANPQATMGAETPVQAQAEHSPQTKKRLGWGTLGVLALLLTKGAKYLWLALKFGVKGKSLLSMVVAIGAYALFFGWPFAVGFVLLIYVHEMGHAIALRREGIRASARRFSFRLWVR